eukprot:Lankesteria_metandrocarpae@DN4425_c0_g1_i1.p1
MIYLYLTNYAEANRELTLLAINTFLKDCGDDDPTIRGLAIRSLCSLKLSHITEFVEPAIRKALVDGNGYVRKAAILGVLKLHAVQPAVVKQSDFMDILHSLLYDSEPLVATNAIHALNEILGPEGGVVVTRNLVSHLVNRIKNFSEWGQCCVLGLVTSYIPRCVHTDEVFDLMNILEDRLKQSSVAIVLACAKCFVEIMRQRSELSSGILHRLKDPLLTLMSTSPPELSYVVTAHIAFLLRVSSEEAAEAFSEDFKNFFCRYNDASHIKSCKLQILTSLTTPSNVSAIQLELADYVCDVDADIARQSILALGTIGLRRTSATEAIISQLLSFLNLGVSYITTAVLIVIRKLVRRFPEHFKKVITAIAESFELTCLTEEAEGRAALLWLIGEAGETTADAPYMFEALLPLFDAATSRDASTLKLNMLLCGMKLFLVRPAEVQLNLGQLLKKAITAEQSPDVRDRALLYYRLLLEAARKGSELKAAKSILFPAPIDKASRDGVQGNRMFAQDAHDAEKANRLLPEFDSLSIIYNQPAAMFCAVDPIPFTGRTAPDECEDKNEPVTGASFALPENSPRNIPEAATSTVSSMRRETGESSADGAFSLLDIQDTKTNADQSLSTRIPEVLSAYSFEVQVEMNPDGFASHWETWPVSSTREFGASEIQAVGWKQLTCGIVEERLDAVNIHCMASGPSQNSLKFFFFAQHRSSGSLVLAEVVTTTTDLKSSSVKITTKTDAHSNELCLLFDKFIFTSIFDDGIL